MYAPLDILYIVLAFCALWLTAAVFWLIYQIASILKNVNETFTQVQHAVDKIEEAVSAIRHKFESAASGIPLLVNGITKIVEYAVSKRGKSSSKQDE